MDYNNIQKLLDEGLNTSRISKLLNIPSSTLRLFIKTNNLKVKVKKYRFPRDEKFFENIDCPIKAYILGYIVADGCIRIEKNKTTKRLRFNSSIDDSEVLLKIKELISPHTKITYYQSKYKIIQGKEVKNIKQGISFGIVSPKIVDTLMYKYNIVPRKTYSKEIFNFKELPIEFYRDFVRGLFDGDGSISCKNVRITNLNKTFLTNLKDIFQSNFQFNNFVRVRDYKGKAPYLDCSGKDFYNNFYYPNCFCLTRKLEKFVYYYGEIPS